MFIDVLAEFLWPIFSYVKDQIIHSSLYFLVLWPFIHKLGATRPALASCLCWLVLLRLLVPVHISSPFSLASWLGTIDEFVVGWPEYNSVQPDAMEQNHFSQVEVSHMYGYLLIIAGCLWLCLSSFLAMEYLSYRKKFKNLASNGTILQHAYLNDMVVEWKANFNITRKIRVVSSSEAEFPFSIGSVAPVIALPMDLLRKSRQHTLRTILAHELAHVKRLDDLSILILIIFKCVFFFFPIVWLCNKYLHEFREKLCDREVLSLNSIEPLSYAQTLLQLGSKSNHLHSLISDPVAKAAESQLLIKRISYLNRHNCLKRTMPMKYFIFVLSTCGFLFPIASHTSSTQSDSGFTSPVENGWISSKYGNRALPMGPDKGKMKFHNGIDIAGKTGTPVLAVRDGVIIEAVSVEENLTHSALGSYVVVAHANNYLSKYTHLEEIHVINGQKITAGSKLGSLGSSGMATGPHLHFELLHNSVAVDPETLIDFGKLTSGNGK